jgi:hypothetical protein
MSNEQLTRLPPPVIDWQARAEEAERLVAELKSGLAHAQGDLFRAQATLARIKEIAQSQAALSVSNGSWQQASRDCGNKILRALEGGK